MVCFLLENDSVDDYFVVYSLKWVPSTNEPLILKHLRRALTSNETLLGF